MNIEAIVLFVLGVVFGLLIVCVVYGVVTYLNKKALGMETLVDQMVKDIIYLAVFFEIILSILRLIDQLTRPFSHSMAVLVTLVTIFKRLSELWQLNMIFFMRYFYVFHYANLNNIDEKVMKRLTRCSVGILSTILTLMAKGNVENTHVYQHLIDGDIIPVMNPVIMNTIISLVIIIIIQFKIEMFKKSVDSKQFDQLESGEEQFGNCQYFKLETYRIEVLILVFGMLFTLSLYWSIDTGGDLNLKYLLAIVYEKFLRLVFTLICIKRSEKMFSFFKNQIITWFCCHQHTNRGIIADLNLDSNNQWQETYVTDSLDQNDDQNSNEDHLDQGEVGGNTGNEIALQRIS